MKRLGQNAFYETSNSLCSFTGDKGSALCWEIAVLKDRHNNAKHVEKYKTFTDVALAQTSEALLAKL